MAESPSVEDRVQIQLGDIIKLEAPSDPDLNEKQFFVSYASPQLIKILSDDSSKEIELPLTSTGEFRNEAIASIDLLGMWPPRTLTRLLGASKVSNMALVRFCWRRSNSEAGAQRQRLPGLNSS